VRTLNKSSTVTGTLAWKTVKNFQTDWQYYGLLLLPISMPGFLYTRVYLKMNFEI
jgi:hypothetical protein